MPITLVQVFLFIAIFLSLLVSIDWLLGKFKKDWAPLPWEEDEFE